MENSRMNPEYFKTETLMKFMRSLVILAREPKLPDMHCIAHIVAKESVMEKMIDGALKNLVGDSKCKFG